MSSSVSATKFWFSRLLLAVLAGAGSDWAGISASLPAAGLKDMASAVAQIEATMLGFVLASLAVLVSVANSRLIRNMQKTQHFRRLLDRMFAAVTTCGLTTIAGVSILMFACVPSWVASAFIALTVLTIAILTDVLRKFWVVLVNLPTE